MPHMPGNIKSGARRVGGDARRAPARLRSTAPLGLVSISDKSLGIEKMPAALSSMSRQLHSGPAARRDPALDLWGSFAPPKPPQQPGTLNLGVLLAGHQQTHPRAREEPIMDYKCFACGETGHLKAQCPTKHRSPVVPAPGRAEQQARDREAHLARIDAIVGMWFDGLLTLHQKRRAIVYENLAHYGGPHGTLTRMP